MDLETNPPQPEPVSDAIRAALADTPAVADPWWQAGIDEALEPIDE